MNRLGDKKRAGIIKSGNINCNLYLDVCYITKPEFFKELQNLLLKYWDLEAISSNGKIKSDLLDKRVKIKKGIKHGLAWNKK